MVLFQLRLKARGLFGPQMQRLGRIVNGISGFLWHRFRTEPPWGSGLWYGWGEIILATGQSKNDNAPLAARFFVASKKLQSSDLAAILHESDRTGVPVFVVTGSWSHWTEVRHDRLIFVSFSQPLADVRSDIYQRLRQYVDLREISITSDDHEFRIRPAGRWKKSLVGKSVDRKEISQYQEFCLRRRTPSSVLSGPVNIVDHTSSNINWIISRLAARLSNSLNELGVETVVTTEPLEHARVIHHLIYLSHGKPVGGSLHSSMLTHVDKSWKMAALRQSVISGVVPIALSSETARLAGQELGDIISGNVPFALIPPLVAPRLNLFTVGIFTRVYGDYRKRQFELVHFGNQFGAGEVAFKIIGDGWEKEVKTLRRKGFEVAYYPNFAHDEYVSHLDSVDAVLYFGWDEGAIGCIDALARGKLVVAPPVGFHLDYNSGNLLFSSNGYESARLLRGHVDHRNQLRRLLLKSSWTSYAESHLEIWDFALTARGQGRTVFF